MNKAVIKGIIDFIVSITLFLLLMGILFILPQWLQSWGIAILVTLGSMTIINPISVRVMMKMFPD